jgi:hypothetical protein
MEPVIATPSPDLPPALSGPVAFHLGDDLWTGCRDDGVGLIEEVGHILGRLVGLLLDLGASE